MYDQENYNNAIDFALNYPPEYNLIVYESDRDIFVVDVFDAGWYTMHLEGKFVRSCLRWKGKKQWSN
jgi:hypothetical protein